MEVLHTRVSFYTSIITAALVLFAFILFCAQSVIAFALFNHILIPSDNYSNNLTIWFKFPYRIFEKFAFVMCKLLFLKFDLPDFVFEIRENLL